MSSFDLAPHFERRWVRPMLKGLDLGRSTAMRRFVAENGRQAAVFAVCVQFWVLLSVLMAMPAGVTLVVGAKDSGAQVLSICLWALFTVSFALGVLRYVQVGVFRKRFRASREAAPTPY